MIKLEHSWNERHVLMLCEQEMDVHDGGSSNHLYQIRCIYTSTYQMQKNSIIDANEAHI
jgi:hypothetical protein